MNFSAAVLVNTGQPLQIINNIQLPQLQSGQVLIKVRFAGICHSQIMEVDGKRGEDKYLPHLLGHEGTGTVVEVGPDVTKVKPNDNVIMGWLKGDGLDVRGAIYDSKIGKINSGAVTTFSQYTIVSENRCYKLPQNIPMREGVLLGCAIPTGMGMVQNQITLSPRDSVGVFGLGGIGISALIAAVQFKPKLLIAIDTNPEKLLLAKKIGADVCLNPKECDLHSEISNHTNGQMLTSIIEAAGSCHTIEKAFSLINPQQGKCIFASHPKAGDKIQLDPFELICGKKIEGSWGGQADPEKVVRDISQQNKPEKLTSLLSKSYPLADINTALDDLRHQKVVRAIIDMEL